MSQSYTSPLLGALFPPAPGTWPAPATNLLFEAIFKRPRNRSEWQERFSYWQRPASETEEAKIEVAARRVGVALRRVPLEFTFEDYKAHIAWCLEQEFGHGAVRAGKKAVHVNKDAFEKIQVDVVPAFTYQLF